MFDFLKKKPVVEPEPPKPVVKHRVVQPRDQVIAVFRPTQNFVDYPNGKVQSSYIKGRQYFLRVGNEALAAKCEEWLRQGLIKWG